MSLINLFWELNVGDTTKTVLIVGIIVSILALCVFSGKNKTNKKNKPSSKCERNYTKCMENNIKNKKNDFCYPCLNDGNAPDFFFNPKTNEWVASR